ncbi:retinol dehydrogenase 16-like isoform X2 [Biomphalaria glabrata]|nr:retinol dehydrogenase 16-like isoform X2 [Biomphalaria glabrata]
MRLLKVGNYGDRYVMVTDCDSAFGQSLVHRLDYLGFHVFAGCLTEDGRIFLSGNCSNRVATFLLDVTKTKRIEAVVQAVRRLLPNSKGLWGLVNNAGILGNTGQSESCIKDDYVRVLEVNLLGMIEVTRQFLPYIRKEKGRVVNMSDMFGRLAIGLAPYTVSKFGVEAYSDILRREMCKLKVKVCIIEPGSFRDTLFMDAIRPDSGNDLQDRSIDDLLETSNLTASDVARNSSFMPVLSACTHALTSTFPNTRYVIGYDAWLVHLPLTYLPTWIPDWIYALPECSYTHSNIATGIASGYQN